MRDLDRARFGTEQLDRLRTFEGEAPRPGPVTVSRAVAANNRWARSLGWGCVINGRVRAMLEVRVVLGLRCAADESETELAAAVARWQRGQGLPSTGELDTTTWERMRPLIREPRPGSFQARQWTVRHGGVELGVIDKIAPYQTFYVDAAGRKHFGPRPTDAERGGVELQLAFRTTNGEGVRRAGFERDGSNFGGTYNFASLADYAGGNPTLFSVRRGNPAVSFSDTSANVFGEVDFRPRDSVGIVAGLRYDWQSRVADLDNVAPRVSVAFAPAGPKIVVRGGAGVFYRSLPDEAVGRSLLFAPGGLQEAAVASPPFPLPASGVDFSDSNLTLWRLAPDLRLPRTTQTTIGVERLLWPRSTLAVEFLHLKTSGAFRSHDVNAPAPDSGIRPDPARSNVNRIESTGASRTNAMTATFRGYIAGFKGSVQYVLARTIDDSSGVFDLPADNHDFAAERGRADFDRRHRLNVAGTYEWANDRMRLAALLALASGAPFDVTTGSDDNQDLVVGDRPAGVTRNTGMGPGLAQLDLRFTTILRAPRPPSADPESSKRDFVDNLELNLDVFNVLNTLNATSVVGVAGSPLFGRPAAVRPAHRSSSRCATASDDRFGHRMSSPPALTVMGGNRRTETTRRVVWTRLAVASKPSPAATADRARRRGGHGRGRGRRRRGRRGCGGRRDRRGRRGPDRTANRPGDCLKQSVPGSRWRQCCRPPI